MAEKTAWIVTYRTVDDSIFKEKVVAERIDITNGVLSFYNDLQTLPLPVIIYAPGRWIKVHVFQ